MALLLAAGRTASSQDTASVPCVGQRIDAIVIRSSAPTVAAFRKVPVLAHVVSTIHVTTNVDVIRRFVLLREGDRCDELRRAESERILRAQPFIAEASVRVVPDTEGGVELDVRTTDEIALVLGGATGRGYPPIRFVRLGNSNVAGEGIYAAADWRAGGAFRDGFGGRFVDNQLLGRPYTLTAEAHQSPLGSDWQTDAAHPFYTDIQRIAWRARSGGSDDYVQFLNDINSSHALRVTRNYFDVGGIVRLGPPGRLSLFGASISGDDERPGTEQVLVTTKGFAPDTSTLLLNRYEAHRIARVNALWGVRDIGFVRVRGFDALTATQDMPMGFQLGTMFGRSLAVLGSRDDDIFMAGDMYIGAVGHNNALRFQLEAEGRRSNDDAQWDGLLTSARAVEYFKITNNNTTTASLEFSGGWRQRLPFNLTLGDRDGGVRGYASSNTPGGQRLVGRLENRVFTGRPFNLLDMGVGLFADAGRLWAGDIPYGVTTPVRKSVGISLLGTIPPGSARLWRIDLAVATNPEIGGHRIELRMSSTNKTTFFLPEPADIQVTRERTVPSSVFRWPR
ncbi:MAG: hypothetical protein JWM41_1866 [Gemmatimonadetes bacterium]|nr:hypothetical protein [Gemmatimonadota bacterium]